MDLLIRRPERKDFASICQLFTSTVNNNFQVENIIDPSGQAAAAVIQNLVDALELDFQSHGQEEYFLIATSPADTIYGTIAYGPAGPLIHQHLPTYQAHIPEVKCVYILPQFQKRGIGTRLFQAMMQELTQNQITQFYLDCGFRASQPFWRKKLGSPTMILNNYWGKGQDHLIWQKPIQTFQL
ncbi:MAG: GNAT family N-acetyltransferase [Bacteroidota bacterium]